ncbi:glycosyl hydrolase [Kushneria pakistanensis]|uniref:Glycosyl hydrolase n=1 Tax=Kushneria pakistanensis TaxID=1508770 RepID=A0ABQ3FHN8_9GAMM|nr:glycoside hydrolase family 3 C-terminal domain-containing protein [Kushneria pakistanensis]GHC24377.1 glycosyl hydrolase [Kushneria pakistanensis]
MRQRTFLSAITLSVVCFSGQVLATQMPPVPDQRPGRLAQAEQALSERLSQAPWMDQSRTPDERARAALAEMTTTEKMQLLAGDFAAPMDASQRVRGAIGSAGFVPGVSRLGIPAQQQTDADLGVTNPGWIDPDRQATALPSVLAAAATWQPALSRQGGEMIAREARHYGFNVLLGGTAGLIRDPRAGRNYEMPGEDPLLSGLTAAAKINGIESQHVMSTIKHFAMNAQETGRHKLSADISDQALQESDLLSFRYALEHSHPGAAMCAYNRVNGDYACQNNYLLNQVLKDEWGYPGFVMSDWGAVYSGAPSANAGLDQQSAAEDFDGVVYFGALLEKAVERGEVSRERIDDMAFRILRSTFASGLVDHPPAGEPIDEKANADVAQTIAENAMVLLKNDDDVLPLDGARDKRISVTGAHADRAVIAGGGSAAVVPMDGDALPDLNPPKGVNTQRLYPKSSPLGAIGLHAPESKVSFSAGNDIDEAVRRARESDVAIVFAQQWTSETMDMNSLALEGEQNALIEAVAKANPRTVVVLETGGPVAMPWRDDVKAIVEAWYPGQRGGEAIANVLFGQHNPSGRLPVTFPQNDEQLPRPQVPGLTIGNSAFFDVDYNREGADVGYRWFEREGKTPLYPFGHGLSYTTFERHGLRLEKHGQNVTAHFTVTNTGDREGRTTPQLYVHAPDGSPARLGGWKSLELAPGQSREVSIEIDPRQFARYDSSKRQWQLAGGDYRVSLADSATGIDETQRVALPTGVVAMGKLARDPAPSPASDEQRVAANEATPGNAP